MHKSDKQLMREGNYTEALGDNYNSLDDFDTEADYVISDCNNWM